MDLIDLVPWLETNGVLTLLETESIKACTTPYKQNVHLLKLMMMKSNEQIQTFIQGLIECNQAHLAQEMDPEGDNKNHSQMSIFLLVNFVY